MIELHNAGSVAGDALHQRVGVVAAVEHDAVEQALGAFLYGLDDDNDDAGGERRGKETVLGKVATGKEVVHDGNGAHEDERRTMAVTMP